MFCIQLRIIEDELWEEAGELMLAVSKEEMEDSWDSVCDSSLFQRMCNMALSADNSAMSIRLQIPGS